RIRSTEGTRGLCERRYFTLLASKSARLPQEPSDPSVKRQPSRPDARGQLAEDRARSQSDPVRVPKRNDCGPAQLARKRRAHATVVRARKDAKRMRGEGSASPSRRIARAGPCPRD